MAYIDTKICFSMFFFKLFILKFNTAPEYEIARKSRKAPTKCLTQSNTVSWINKTSGSEAKKYEHFLVIAQNTPVDSTRLHAKCHSNSDKFIVKYKTNSIQKSLEKVTDNSSTLII